MKNVIGYARVSTDKQGQSGLGLAAQIDKITSYCKTYDLNLTEIIQDTASGKSLKCDGLNQSLSALKCGNVEGIIIAKLDRLTRSVKDMGILLESYFNTGQFALYCVGEQIDTSTASGRMMINILMSVAQWEREAISERTKDALRAKKRKGQKTGGSIPFGYDCVNGQLVKNPNEQGVIELILSLKSRGYSFQKIADRLNQDKYLSKTGRLWAWKSTRKIYLRAVNA